jgi:hypothetical protein
VIQTAKATKEVTTNIDGVSSAANEAGSAAGLVLSAAPPSPLYQVDAILRGHCEEQRDEAIQSRVRGSGLLRLRSQ